ncbi:hypothetical protein HDV04_005499 [Boothiomyces sp. JEL0838]|nr:hypothetical protein HDV04_005499 [Boothiomyces sp. JEL0838]
MLGTKAHIQEPTPKHSPQHSPSKKIDRTYQIKQLEQLLQTNSTPDLVLDATASSEQLISKVTEMRNRLELQLLRLEQAQVEHGIQAQENITLKQYVSNLLSSTNRLGE